MQGLRRIRAERQITLRELEQMSGVSKETISGIERGTRSPQTLTLGKLAAALEVDVDDLVEEPASRPKALFRAPLDLDWAVSVPEDVFERLLGEAPLDESVALERAMVERFRELKDEHLPTRRPELVPAEFLVLWGRIKDVQRHIVGTRRFREEALITPEINPDFNRDAEATVRQLVGAQT